jgi:pimeloyl-ACP methyl ester carboxylesterase
MNRLIPAVKMLNLGAALLAAVSLTGCGTRLEPRVATVNGHAVELATAGTGNTTVVFESGLGSDWTVWDEVAAEVARSSRVFAYSRPGYGQSGPTTTPRDASHIVEELRALLGDQGYRSPYILVGHSFGGAYMELFAKAHPDEVTALVLVEPRHSDFTTECEARNISGCSISASVSEMMPQVQQDELAAFAEASGEIRAAGPFGRYPVRVLTATSHFEGDDWEVLWQSMLGSLATEAADGKQLFFPGAGHNLEVERAQDVARIILEQVRAQN